jgi:hypothetical protein
MVRFFSCVGKTGADILGFKIRIVREDLGLAEAGGQQIKNILNPDTHAPNAGPAAALLGIEGYPIHAGNLGILGRM